MLATIEDIVQSMDANVGIWDTDGEQLMGDRSQIDPSERYPICVADRVLGWVMGGKEASAIATLLNYLVNQELEKRKLANEVLGKYRQVSLLAKLSERLAIFHEVESIAELALVDARKLIAANSGWVMLLDRQTETLKTIAVSSQTLSHPPTIQLGEGIVGSIALSGKAEIVNDIHTDPRHAPWEQQMQSLLCVPLIADTRVIGAIGLISKPQTPYKFVDLRLLKALASQTAPAIENARFYRQQLEASQAREAALQQQLKTLRIGIDQVKLAHQVHEITATEYFQQLKQQAQKLRQHTKKQDEE